MPVKRTRSVERANLTYQKIIDAALRIVRTKELNQLSIRKLASELGASPMAIYFYFPSKAELVDAVLKAFVDKANVTGHGVDPKSWKQWIASTYFAIFSALREMPGIVPYMGDLRLFGSAGLKVNQEIRAALHRGGLTPKRSHQVSLALLAQTIGYVVLDLALVSQSKSLRVARKKRVPSGKSALMAIDQLDGATARIADELTEELRHLDPQAGLQLFMAMIEKTFSK